MGGENLTQYSISRHKELSPICIHPCKQGQATKEDSKHTCRHCRVLALGMQTHIHDTAGRSQTSMQTWLHTTDKSVRNIGVKFVRFLWGGGGIHTVLLRVRVLCEPGHKLHLLLPSHAINCKKSNVKHLLSSNCTLRMNTFLQ